MTLKTVASFIVSRTRGIQTLPTESQFTPLNSKNGYFSLMVFQTNFTFSVGVLIGSALTNAFSQLENAKNIKKVIARYVATEGYNLLIINDLNL